jgi:hypothetical protein
LFAVAMRVQERTGARAPARTRVGLSPVSRAHSASSPYNIYYRVSLCTRGDPPPPTWHRSPNGEEVMTGPLTATAAPGRSPQRRAGRARACPGSGSPSARLPAAVRQLTASAEAGSASPRSLPGACRRPTSRRTRLGNDHEPIRNATDRPPASGRAAQLSTAMPLTAIPRPGPALRQAARRMGACRNRSRAGPRISSYL